MGDYINRTKPFPWHIDDKQEISFCKSHAWKTKAISTARKHNTTRQLSMYRFPIVSSEKTLGAKQRKLCDISASLQVDAREYFPQE